MRSAATPHAAAASDAHTSFEQRLQRMHAHKQIQPAPHLHPALTPAASTLDKDKYAPLDVLERCTPSPSPLFERCSEIPIHPSGGSGAEIHSHATATSASAWMSPTNLPHPTRTSTPTPTTASRVAQYRRLSLPSPHTAASTVSPHTATSLTQCSTSTSAGPPTGCSSLGSSISSAGGLLLSCDSTPMSMLRLDFLSPSSSPPPSCSSSTFASSSSMSSRSTVSARTAHGLFSPNTMSERNNSSAFSASEEGASDGDSSASFSSAEPIATSTPGFVHSTGGPSPTVRAGVCMRAGVLCGVPSNQVSEMRSKRRRQLQHQSQLATIRSSSGSSNSAIAASSPFTAPASHPSSLDVALEHVPAPLFPSPSPHSGCSDSTLSPSPLASNGLGSRRSSFITPYPSPVNRTPEEIAALQSSTQQMLEAMRLQLPSAAAGFEDASATAQQVGVCAISPQVLTSLTLPLRSLKLRASGSNGSNGSPPANSAAAASTPTGSPLAEMTEEQRNHINSLVRKSKPKRSSKRGGRRGGPPPASSSNSRLPHASPPFGGKLGRTPSNRPPPSLLSVPFVSPLSSSPAGSPRGPQLGASPRNFNLFKLKLPGMSPSLSSVMSGDETPSSLALTSASSAASASGPLRTPETDETDEDDFSALATPGNAGLGAEEDGEIVLCGIHGQGSTTHRRGNSADTTDSENESTPGSNSQSSILTLLPITETSPTLNATTAPSVEPVEVKLELAAATATAAAPSHVSLQEPTFDSSFDTSALEASAAKPAVQLQASAAQVVAEASLTGTVLASPPLPSADSDRLPELAAAFGASKRKVSRRATMSGCEGISVATASGGASNRKNRTVPYDFSPAGHLIIDGFEISRKGVTHTPEVSARRLSINRGSSSCCTSPSSKVVPSEALLSDMRARARSVNPDMSVVESVRSAIAGESPAGDTALPRTLFSTLSEPNSLTNTPTLLGRRLSIVKLQQQREKEKAAAKPRHRRYGSAEVSPTSQLSLTSTPEPAAGAGSLVPSSSFDSTMSMDSLNSLLADDACASSSTLKSSFGPKFKAPKPASLGIELRLNDLVRLGEIGRGANGAVHKAVHLPTLKIVALKSVSIFDKDERHQFLQELHAFLNVQSTQCVKFVGACFAEGMITMALEYLNRGSIDHVVERSGPFDEAALKVVLQQLLMGIRDLHASHFIHRDLKPGNILINSLGVVKVSDFGLMKQLDVSADGSGTVEPCSKFVGTMLYLAPERIRGDPFSFPSDIYAVGLVTIYMALGELQQVPKDYWGLVQGATAADGPTPGLPEDGRFSRELRELVGHMMCKDPKDRWTAEQLLEHPWFTSEAASDPAVAAAAAGGACLLSPSKLVDPLEHWSGRQLEDPHAEELSILIEAVIKRWYAMPTREVMCKGGEAAQAFLQQFEPSSFDLARFTHLAQQLGWHAQPVIAAFTETIREKINAALEEIAAASWSSASDAQQAGEQQLSAGASIFSSAASSIRSSLCNAFGGGSGSQDNSAAPSPLLASASFNLPRLGSRSALLSNCSSRSLNSSPLPPQCLSPTSSSLSSRPPKVPQRSRSPSVCCAENMPLLSLGPAYSAEPHSPVHTRRTSGRTLSSSGRRESFHMRAAEALALVGQTVAAASQASSCAASPATRSLGLGGPAADSTGSSILPHPPSSRPLSIGSAAELLGSAAMASRGSPLLPPL